MNQTQKRLQIIKIAISITDMETVQLQVLKLGLLKKDEKIQEILDEIEEQNYVKTQELIKLYIENPSSQIISRNSHYNAKKEKTREKKDTPKIEEEKKEKKDTFFEDVKEEKSQKDDFFDTKEEIVILDKPLRKEYKPNYYEPTSYIEQKFLYIQQQYPLKGKKISKKLPNSVNEFLLKIKNEGYSEDEVKEVFNKIEVLKKRNKTIEAGLLILLCASTQSNFAQLILARELFKGDILVKNIDESFSILYSLHIDNYSEAKCDIAQFYEYGLGNTPKNLKKAQELYKEAFDLGVKRAQKHYLKLKNKKGFSLF